MYLILIILVTVFIFYVADKLTSEADRKFWLADEKIFIKISALVPILLGCVWFLTFGFTDYRGHLAFIGFPLSLFALTYGFLTARLNYSIILLNCVLAFAASIFLTVVAISMWFVPALVPAIFGFVYVFVLRKGLHRRSQNKLKNYA